jgi:nucleoside-diphosphate-sugar epimerase
MKVLVIGGTGFIGPPVVRRLAEHGHEVTVFHRGKTEAELPASVRHIHHDWDRWSQPERLFDFARELSQLSPDVVLDMIAMTEASARAAVDTFRGVARRLVLISSQDVYRAYARVRGKEVGPPDPVPLTEDSPLRDELYPYRDMAPPDDPNHWSRQYEKILVERVVMGERELIGTVLRLPAVYGPGDQQHRLFPYLKRMHDGRRAILETAEQAAWRWSRGYVENISAAIALAVADDRAAGRTYNVAEPEALSESAWVKAIGRAAGWDGEVVIVPADQLPAHLQSDAHLEQHLSVDSTCIRQELEYIEPISFDQGLRRTVEWELGHPPEKLDPAQFDYAAEDQVLAGLTG